MGFIALFIFVVGIFILYFLTRYPTQDWCPPFFLDFLPEFYWDKPLWTYVLLEHQALWFGLVIIAVFIGGIIAIVKK